MKKAARATIVVTQRERFGMTAESLDSLFDQTDTPFDLVYVDGASPPSTARYLASQSIARGFTLLRRERYLTPNQARNLGIANATTDYVVFCDNDVIYTPGWLTELIRCADDTGAEIVAPLTCHALPAHETIHHAGGLFTEPDRVEEFRRDLGEKEQYFIENMLGYGQKKRDYARPLEREETGYCEFHCALVRRSVFDRLGRLDERMLSSKEHIDFSLSVQKAGGKVFFEPASVVTYVFPNRDRPLTREDWGFFAFRWSDAYGHRSLKHFFTKWKLRPHAGYAKGEKYMYSWRRREGIVRPIVRQLPLIGRSPAVTTLVSRAAMVVERPINRALVALHDQRA